MTPFRRFLLYAWFLLIVRPITRLLIGVAVLGREHFRHQPPAIILANHNSHLDAAILMDLLPLRLLPCVRPVAAADYFEKGRLRRFIWRCCMNVLPIRRDVVSKTHNPLTAMIEAVDAGTTLLLFPEGTRGRPEVLSEFQAGVAHLLRRRPDLAVIPVYMRNLGFSLPKGDFILVPMFCDVYIGPPRTIAGTKDEIMAEIAAAFDHLQRVAEKFRRTAEEEDDANPRSV